MERVATLLATTAPKGLLVNRDEVIGWLESMKLRPGAREFWVQAYGGRPYRVERQKHLEPIEIERLAVGVLEARSPL